MLAFWIALGILVLLMLALYGTCRLFYQIAISRKGRSEKSGGPGPGVWGPYRPFVEAGAEWLDGMKPQLVHHTSRESLQLAAYYLPHPQAKGAVIYQHGYRGKLLFESGYLARHYYEKGYSVLLCSHRSHGESQGEHITYGIREHEDCLRWVDWLAAREPGVPIFLHGLSMGGATVLLCADSVPSCVKGIVGDCGFTDPWSIFAHVMKRDFHLPTFPILPAFRLYCRRFAGFDLKEKSTLQSLAHSKVPVLLIHGEKDDFVPYAMGLQNRDACSRLAGFVSVPGAAHAQAIPAQPERCLAAIDAFMESQL